MRNALARLGIACLIATPVAFGSGSASSLWSSKVQPLFDVQCVKCHGPIEQKSGLELDTPEAVMRGGDEGQVVVPGEPDESRLYLYLAEGSDPHMPPKKQLSDSDRALVRDWILALGDRSAETNRAQASDRVFASAHEAVDAFVSEHWKARGIDPAGFIDDRAWCRRLYLDLAGRIPTPSETLAFLSLPESERRAALVGQLLQSKEYPVRMRELWDVFLMGRTKRDSHEDRRKEKGWWAFLERSFDSDRPWNETVREILVARPQAEEDKGAYWFLFERRNEHQAIAEAVAPVVYGARIDCAQCHDHPLAREIKQAHYWGLVAAFNRSKNVDGAGVSESAVGGFVNFTNLKKESQPALVTLLNGRTVPESWPEGDKKEDDSDDKYLDPKARVRVPKFSRREAFADAATSENPLLARAFVNRMWASLLGRGIVHPADEMTGRNAPSHPELLEWLAADFAKHNYNVRRLVRGIVLSQAYALSHGDRPADAFASAVERPLAAEQLARSWRVAAGLDFSDDKLRRSAVGAIPEVQPKEYNATFQQAQFLSSSPALFEILKPHPGGTIERLAQLQSPGDRARGAFSAVLGREPDAEELRAACEFLSDASESGALRDLLWALMTSAEFQTMP